MKAKLHHLMHTLLLALGLREAPHAQLAVVRCVTPAQRPSRRHR